MRNLRTIRIALIMALSVVELTVCAQVTVGDGAPPHDFSVLEVSTAGTRGGLRLPQLTTTQRNAWRDYFLGISTGNPVNPSGSGIDADEQLHAPGLSIFNTDTKCFEYWNASRWVSLCEGNSLMTVSPEPCKNVAADGTGCGGEFTITDPDCPNGPFTIVIVAGTEYASLYDVNMADGIFRIAFQPNNSVNLRSVVVRVTGSCTGLYKDFLFTQAGHPCDASLGTAPAITAVPSTFRFCAEGAAYLSVNETSITGTGTLGDVIWTRNNIEVARGVNSLVVTQEGKYEVWMGFIGCNAGTGSVTITRDGTGAPQPVSIVVTGNNGMVCGSAGTTRLVAINPNGSGEVLWFKDGILQDGTNGTGDITGTAVTVGIGSWFAVVRDGDCYSHPSETVTVIENPESGGTLTPPVIDKGGSFCAGSSVLLSVSTGSYNAAYTYTWYENNTQIGMGSSVMYTVPSGASQVVIRCRATLSSSCAQEALTVETITTGTIPARPVITGNTVLCSGTATLNVIPSGTGTYTYAWYKDNTPIGTDQSITVTSGGDYYATVTDGCTSPRAHINIPAISSATPSVTFESAAAVPGQANTGDIITYRASITFGPALSYTWTTGNATVLAGGGISDNYAVVQYGSAGSPAFVQVVVTNACGAGTGRRDVASVGTDCEEAIVGTLNPSAEQSKSAIAGTSFTMGPVSVSFGSSQTAYQWYRNTVKSTAGATVQSSTSNTLITSESAGIYYYYCVMSNKSNCGATPVTSPFYTVTVNDIPAAAGTGNFTGKTCFDIAYSNFSGGCGTEAARLSQKTDFSLTGEQDPQAGTGSPIYTGRQVYTFTLSGNVSNVRFVYQDVTGQAIESMTAKADYSGNISSGTLCKAVVVYKTSLNDYLKGKTNEQAVTLELYVIYNDMPNQNGVDRFMKLTVRLQDCACCGAATTAGGWLTFMCHNLGTDENLDPFTYVKGNADGSGGTIGWLFQWGRPADGHQLWNSPTTSTRATNNNATSPPEVIGKFIKAPGPTYDWRSSSGNRDRWGDGTLNENMPKAANDPCPQGYKVPSARQWGSIFKGSTTGGSMETATANVWKSKNDMTMIGGTLGLPNPMRRNVQGVVSRTEAVGYWTSTMSNNVVATWIQTYGANVIFEGNRFSNGDGMAVRCVSEY